MAKIRLYTTAIVVLSSTDAVLQQYAAGNYVLDASGQAIGVSGNGIKARFPNLSEITAITDAAGSPVTLPGTQAEYVTLIAGYFRGLATAGGGGGSSDVTVTNLPDDYPDGAVDTKLTTTNSLLGETLGAIDTTNATLGTAGTAETGTIPDSAAQGTGLRKLLWRIYVWLWGINDYTALIQNDVNATRIATQSADTKLSGVINTRTRDYDPATVPSGTLAINTVLGSFEVADSEGVEFVFSTGNSGASLVCQIEWSNNNTTWSAGYGYQYNHTGGGATTTTVTTFSPNSLNTLPRIYVPKQGRYVRIIMLASGVIGAGATARRTVDKPESLEPYIRTVSVSGNVNTTLNLLSGTGTTYTTPGTYLLATGISTSYQTMLFQFNKGAITALTAEIQASIDGTNYVSVGTLNLADFTNPELARKYTEGPYQRWQLVISTITGGTLTFRGYRASL